jgi:hypothetical protein
VQLDIGLVDACGNFSKRMRPGTAYDVLVKAQWTHNGKDPASPSPPAWSKSEGMALYFFE